MIEAVRSFWPAIALVGELSHERGEGLQVARDWQRIRVDPELVPHQSQR